MRKTVFIMASLLRVTDASAQQWGDVDLVNPVGYVPFSLDGLPVSSINPNILASGCNANMTACGTVGIPVQDFAETSAVNAQFGAVNAQFGAVNAQIAGLDANLTTLTGEVRQLGARLNAGLDRADQLAVAAASLKDAIPNDGDRFAVRLNMALWNGAAAGGVSFSVNVSDAVRLSADYGRSQNQNIMSGGLNFSFR